MYTRVITYDLHYADIYDYKELYKYLDSVGAKKLTESSYLIETDLVFSEFKNKIISITKPGDNIKAIVKSSTDNLEVWNIR